MEGVFVLKENTGVQKSIQEQRESSQKMTVSLQESMEYMRAHMAPDTSFDVVYRVIEVGGRQACIYFIDGFCTIFVMSSSLQKPSIK